MKPPAIPLEHIRQTLPVYRMVIPDAYEDHNGHMNIRWYLVIFDEAGLPLYERIGLEPDDIQAQGNGTFDLENHLHYINEVHVGDEVTVYARMVGRSAKRIHYLMFMVNETRETLASIFECVNSFVDLTARRTAPYPDEIASKIDAMIANHQALAWDAPICGVMGA